MDYEELDKRLQFSESIIQSLRGTTGNNFQNNVGIILREYYKFKEKQYIMPEPMGGDYKNDGYVVNDAIFYMIYSPLSHVDNITQSIKNKFEGDLKGLLYNVYEKNMWNGKVNKTIFLVNNIDRRLPPDPEDFFNNTVKKYKEKYNISFENKLMDTYDFKRYLDELPLNLLINIKTQLNISNMVDFNVPNMQAIIETISCIANEYNVTNLYSKKIDEYKRISTPQKIKINKLEERSKEINAILTQEAIVEKTIKNMNQDITQATKFEKTRQYIINLYQELSQTCSGVELYDAMIEQTIQNYGCMSSLIVPLKFLIVYIFDKCDIFEKEEE